MKGTIQKLLGVVPGGAKIQSALQRRVGGLADFDEECDSKVADWLLMVGHLKTSGLEIAGAKMLEVGTGWYPTFPICLYLAGVGRVLTMDLNRYMDRRLLLRLVERLAVHVETIARVSGQPETDVRQRLTALSRALQAKAPLAAATDNVVEYRAPADATVTGLEAGSVDAVFSNSVLEHVPPDVIDNLFTESLRILVPGGRMFHSVDCGDHYSYVDRSINQLHYLQYSDEAWQWWNNKFLYQNRLRAVDYIEKAKQAGFAIEIDTSKVREERLEQLKAINVAPKFSRYTRDQLAITTVDFVGRTPSAH